MKAINAIGIAVVVLLVVIAVGVWQLAGTAKSEAAECDYGTHWAYGVQFCNGFPPTPVPEPVVVR